MDEEIKIPVGEHSGPDGESIAGLAVAVDTFQKEFKRRPFSGRNAQLGKMIKCPLCSQRHRESQCYMKDQKFANRPGTPEGESDPMTAETKTLRTSANPFWRSHPGVMQFVPALKKYVRIVR